MDSISRKCEIYEAFAFFDLCGICGLDVDRVLRGSGESARADSFDGLEHQGAAAFSHFVVDRFKIILGENVNALGQQNVTCVKSDIHHHCGDSREFLAVNDGSLHRRGTSVFGQKRAVNVDAAVLGVVEHVLRQYLAVSGNYDHLGRDLVEKCGEFLALESGRLINGDVTLKRADLDRAGCELVSATNGAVGQSDDTDNVLARVAKSGKRDSGEVGSAHE